MAKKTNSDSSKANVDKILAGLPADKRSVLEKLRKTIRAAAPKAEDGLSYGIPALRIHGRPLVSYVAAKDHLSFYVMSPAVMEAHKAEMKGYDTSKGTIRFAVDKPLPAALVTKLVKARLKELEAK